MNDGKQTKLWINDLKKVVYDPIQSEVRGVILKANQDTELTGLQFLDEKGCQLLEAGRICDGDLKLEIQLEQGERLVGFKAQLFDNTRFRDLQFLIGKVE